MRRRNLSASVIVLGGIVGAFTLAAGAAEPTSYARDVEPILIARCGDCHSADNPKKGLDLSKGAGHTALINVKSQETDQPLVKPGDPDASYLWAKLTHTHQKGKGMPRTLFGAKKLPQAQLDVVRTWISQGARP